MAPTLWTSPKQFDFLSAQLDAYQAAQKSGHFTAFWGSLYDDWFPTWPEQPLMFPNRDVGPLDDAEKEVLR